jgi:hypothetical protein
MPTAIRDRILQQALAADFSPQGKDVSAKIRLGV